MEIAIQQNKISIGEKYKIYLNKEKVYFASSMPFRFLSIINLFKEMESRPRIVLKKRWSWFETKYDIFRNDHEKLEFRTISVWKNHHKCRVGQDYYEVFGHRGKKYSVFKNNNQIAFWDKNTVVWFEGDNYVITANNDCDIELIISFCLIIDNKSENGSSNGNTLTIDIGNIGFEARKFDVNWKPK